MTEAVWGLRYEEEIGPDDSYIRGQWLPEGMVLKWLITREQLVDALTDINVRWFSFPPRGEGASEQIAERARASAHEKAEDIWTNGPRGWLPEGCDVSDIFYVARVSLSPGRWEWIASEGFGNPVELDLLSLMNLLESERPYLEDFAGVTDDAKGVDYR